MIENGEDSAHGKNKNAKYENFSLKSLSESAQKIKQLEDNQMLKIQNQLRSIDVEISRLKDESNRCKVTKEEKKLKLLEVNQAIISSFSKLQESTQFSDPEIKSLVEQNAELANQMSLYVNNEKETVRLQRVAESLETELFELTEKRAISNEDMSPQQIQRLKENKTLLKKQINEMENFIRNGVRYEFDEAKNRIKILQKSASSISSELRQLKEEQKKWDQPDKKNSTDSLQLLLKFCEELENEVKVKQNDVLLLRDENKKWEQNLVDIREETSKMEKEILSITRSISGL